MAVPDNLVDKVARAIFDEICGQPYLNYMDDPEDLVDIRVEGSLSFLDIARAAIAAMRERVS